MAEVKGPPTYTVEFGRDDPSIDDSHTAALEFYEPEGFRRELWRIDTRISRHNGPALTLRDDHNKIRMIDYFDDGVRHRDGDLPAVEYFFEDGGLMAREWFQKGLLHREGAPAAERYNPAGRLLEVQWSIRDCLHRIGGPALLHIDPETGVVTHEQWQLNGQLHRLDGPAIISRDEKSGEVQEQGYYSFGQMISPHNLSFPAPSR